MTDHPDGGPSPAPEPAPGERQPRAGRSPHIVAFGGGTGMAALLRGLRRYTDRITAVVTVTDNGGSSGRLRNDFDIAAPGDIRNCLVALADVDPVIEKALQYRFEESEFKGHCFGNLFITVMARVVGDFSGSIAELNRFLRVKGQIIPASSTKVSLVAHHADGSKSTGEVQVSRSGKPIQRIELRPETPPLSPGIRRAVRDADLFLFGPGSLFTSVVPNLLLDGLMAEMSATGRPRVYVGNIMTQPGETDRYPLSEHIRALRRHVGDDFPDAVIAHDGVVPDPLRRKYERQGAQVVVPDLDDREEFSGIRVICRDLVARGDESRVAKSVRHDSDRLAQAIQEEFLARTRVTNTEPPEGDRTSAGHMEANRVQADGTRALR